MYEAIVNGKIVTFPPDTFSYVEFNTFMEGHDPLMYRKDPPSDNKDAN